jgi:hypothetical protein
MLWFKDVKTAGRFGGAFERRMMKAVSPFLQSGILEEYETEGNAWRVIGTKGIIWAERNPDSYSPLIEFPEFELIIDGYGIVAAGEVSDLIQKAKSQLPTDKAVGL